ncbi:MAG: Inhibitor of kappaB kinase gamma-like protein [Verrucomicrobiales bacterium]|jgi:hypothetical protein|nr:Inhibitor of kappaB kinase gamma-like protein [Verrucomicrobiales bacterium]MDB6130950.1 Inhibitor of kappaB kinase gamma-like protein [Verrucomicrobiales bacterium]
MASLKQIRLEQKVIVQQQEVISELEALVQNIERCERTITELKDELEVVNKKHQGDRNTQQDILYLTDLLRCAKKKLNWEKHMATLQKKVPEVLQRVSELANHSEVQPSPETRALMMKALHSIEAAMQRLQLVKS